MSLEWPADLRTMDESSGRTMASNLKIGITNAFERDRGMSEARLRLARP